MTKFEASLLKKTYAATVELGTSNAGGVQPVQLSGTGAATGAGTGTPSVIAPGGVGLAGSGGGVGSGVAALGAPLAEQVQADGAWTWFNEQRAIYYDDRLYVGSITGTATGGDVQVGREEGSTLTTAKLYENLQVDDHDNPALLVLPSGRLGAFYSHHSGQAAGLRYRITTNPLPDISSFATEKTVPVDGTIPTSYAKAYLLSDGIVRVYQRLGVSAERPYNVARAAASALEAGAGAEAWTRETIINYPGQRPYVITVSDIPDRIDFFVTNGHPNEVATSLYHFYMRLIGGVERYFKSDNTEIAARPINPVTDGTLVQNTVGGISWNWDVRLGPDGHPRLLATRYPSYTNAFSPNLVLNDIEYWHYRWTGSAWTGFRLQTGQTSIYNGQSAYAGGLCFDSADVTRVFMSVTVGSFREILEYSIDEVAQTKNLVREVTQASTSHNIRPYSPRNAQYGHHRVLWMSGSYTTYDNYQTNIRGFGRMQPQIAIAPVSLSGSGDASGEGTGGLVSATAGTLAGQGDGVGDGAGGLSVVGGSWGPASWGALVAWYDASDSTTRFTDTGGTTPATAGQAVARLNDKKGTAHITQATSGNRPTVQNNAGIGKVVLDFDRAATQYMTSTDASLMAAVTGDDNGYTIVEAIKRGPAGVSVTPSGFARIDGSGIRDLVRHYIGSGNQFGALRRYGAPFTDISVPETTGSGTADVWYVRTLVFTGTEIIVRVNGVETQRAAMDSPAIVLNTLNIGAQLDNGTSVSAAFDGQTLEILIADATTVSADLIAAEQYLMARVGLIVSGVNLSGSGSGTGDGTGGLTSTGPASASLAGAGAGTGDGAGDLDVEASSGPPSLMVVELPQTGTTGLLHSELDSVPDANDVLVTVPADGLPVRVIT